MVKVDAEEERIRNLDKMPKKQKEKEKGKAG